MFLYLINNAHTQAGVDDESSFHLPRAYALAAGGLGQ
jgi:hypothetical protein